MKCDLHIHSSLSPDSQMEPEEIAAFAQEAGLALVAVCDHNALRENGGMRSYGAVTLLFGTEFSTEIGHILGLFITSDVFVGLGEAPYSAKRVLEQIHAQGGVAILAHPLCAKGRGFEAYLPLFDAVEAYNSRAAFVRGRDYNSEAIAYFAPSGLAFVASSDAHLPREVGNAYTELELEGALLGPDTLRTALRRGGKLFGIPSFPDDSAQSGMIRAARNGKRSLRHMFKLQLKFYYGLIARRLYSMHLVQTRALEGETKHDFISVGKEGQ